MQGRFVWSLRIISLYENPWWQHRS